MASLLVATFNVVANRDGNQEIVADGIKEATDRRNKFGGELRFSNVQRGSSLLNICFRPTYHTSTPHRHVSFELSVSLGENDKFRIVVTTGHSCTISGTFVFVRRLCARCAENWVTDGSACIQCRWPSVCSLC